MSETVDGRVGLCSTFWQRSDDGVWISDGGRDTADPDEFQAALALIDRLARELREAKEREYRNGLDWAACGVALLTSGVAMPEGVSVPDGIKLLATEVARLREALTVPVSEAYEYEGRLEANIQVSVDTLRLLRQFVGAPEEVRDG